MEKEETTKEEVKPTTEPATEVSSEALAPVVAEKAPTPAVPAIPATSATHTTPTGKTEERPRTRRNGPGNQRGGGANNKRGRRPVRRREVSEFEHKVVDMRRVSRTVAGGRRFSFRATVVAGDGKGRVGIGVAKGRDTALSIDKAVRRAKANMISVPITEEGTIPHDVEAKYGPSRVLLRPGRKGLVAGSAVRNVLDLAGVKNVTAKVISRSSNKLNNARAAMVALTSLIEKKHANTRTTSK